MNKTKINYLLYGESTCLNKGCEAIINTTVKKIRELSEGDISLATFDEETDGRYYNDIINKYIKHYYKYEELEKEEQEKINNFKKTPDNYDNEEVIRQKDVIKEIDNIDICISVGGDNYCYGIPNWVYTINKQCKLKGKKTVLWSASIEEKITSDEMVRDLRTYDLIVARESLTYKALEEIMENERLILAPDTAFSLDKKEVELPQIFKNNCQVIGINISPLILEYTDNKEIVFNSIKALIDNILKTTNNNICLIPHVYKEDSNDLDALSKIKKQYIDEKRIEILDDRIYDCEELKYIISKCSMLVAARTHASIAAYSSCVPTLVIGYSTKSKGIALDLFGDYSNYVIPVNTISPEILIEKYNFINENRKPIIKTLKEKMPKYIEEASCLMKNAMKKLDELDKKYVTHKSMCTGCMACYNICPQNAIELYENEEGFIMTKINPEKCVRCNMCKNVCPLNQNYKNKIEQQKLLAVKNKNEFERLKSSSGGVFILLANRTLEKGGIVYGAQLVSSKVEHIRVDNKLELNKIIGSKYAQSEIGTIFKNVKEDLLNKKEVLFTGTPCQIEGLKNYLNEEYNNLLTVSVICHGVPSSKILKQYVKEEDEISEFRNKEEGWHNFKIVYKNGKKISYYKDNYMKCFLNNYSLRESCYNCQCKYYDKNSADIILGDFWGIENILPEIDDDKGVSAVIINSQKGERAFEKIAVNCESHEVPIEKIKEYNPYAINSVKYTNNRADFFKLIQNNQIKASSAYLNEKELNKKMEELINNSKQYERDNKELRQYVRDLEEAKEYFISQIDVKEKQIEEANLKAQELNDKLEQIYNSRIWKYKNKLNKIIKRNNC